MKEHRSHFIEHDGKRWIVNWRLVLPKPPSKNRYWRIWKNRPHLSKEANAFRKAVIEIVGNAGLRVFRDRRIAVRMVFFPHNKRKHDVQNYTGGVLDALEHAEVFENDEQCDTVIISRGPVLPDGGVLVEIANIDPRDTTGFAETNLIRTEEEMAHG